jgi:hypothetical protein
MASLPKSARLLILFALVPAILIALRYPTVSRGAAIADEILIDQTTEGYYNYAANMLDNHLPWFPPPLPPDPKPEDDPTLNPIPEPDRKLLASVTGLDALLQEDPLPLGPGWGGLRIIPSHWTSTTENAIIYEIDAGPLGIDNLTGSFGVDNGIYVWVNGRYKFGAMAPGTLQDFEYEGIRLGDLHPGKNYVQILREDHGGATGYKVEVTGTPVTGDAAVVARVKAPDVSYDGEPQQPGQDIVLEPCPAGTSTPGRPCSPLIEMARSLLTPEQTAALDVSCVNRVLGLFLLARIKLDSEFRQNPAWWLIENGEKFVEVIKGYCSGTPQVHAGAEDPAVYFVNLGLGEGGLILDLVIPNYQLRTVTAVGDFTMQQPGRAKVAYDPDTESATATAVNTTVLVEPNGRDPLTIGPAQRVVVTAEMVGPVTDLPLVFVPAILR